MNEGYKENYIYFSAFDKNLKNIYLEDKDKYIVLSGIIFHTNFQDKYEKLREKEFYFSYSVYEKETGIKRTKLQRIIKELERDGFIKWIYKSDTRYKESIIRLNFEHGKGYGKRYGRGYGKEYDEITENATVSGCWDMVKSTEKDTVKDTYSKNISTNISILHKEETNYYGESKKDIRNIYKQFNALKKYDNHKELIHKYQEIHGTDVVVLAILESANRGKLEIYYIRSVLDDWLSKGLRNREQIIIHLKNWQENKKLAKEKREKKVSKQATSTNYKSSNEGRMRFNNFEPRVYDYDDLEKKLLGWDKDEDDESQENGQANKSESICRLLEKKKQESLTQPVK